MPDLLIRNLDPEVVSGLKRLAAKNGRSVQAEAQLIIELEVERRQRNGEFWERAAELRKRFQGPLRSDSTDLIREDRDTDHGRD
jgi:plasmid stability protein